MSFAANQSDPAFDGKSMGVSLRTAFARISRLAFVTFFIAFVACCHVCIIHKKMNRAWKSGRLGTF